MPEFQAERTYLVSELKRAATTGNLQILPVTTNWSGFSYLRDHDGFGVYAGAEADPSKASAVVFCFGTGELWSIDTYLLDRMEWDRLMWVPIPETEFGNALISYAGFIRKLGIDARLRWIAGMENLRNRILPSKHGYEMTSQQLGRRCLLDVVTAEGVYVPDEPPLKALQPFFERLYDACGTEWAGARSLWP